MLGKIDDKNNPKFKDVSEFIIPELNWKFINLNTNSKNAIVYCAFHHLNYLKFGFLSLLSQIANTDIEDYNCFFIIDRFLYNDAINTIGKIIPKENIIISDIRHKYYMFYLPQIQQLDKVLMVDCDGFMLGNKTNIYHKIFKYNIPLVGKDGGNVNAIINSRLSHVDHKTMFETESLKKYLKDGHWAFNGFSLHPLNCINLDNIKEEYWIKDIACDETILLYNYMKNNIEYDYITKYIPWVHSNTINNFLDEENPELSFVHPVEGNCEGKRIKDVFNKIINDYTLYLESNK